MIYFSFVPFVIIAFTVNNMPNAFPLNEDKIGNEGIDPDLVELTLREKGKRTSYDNANVLIQSRRNTISQIMLEIGMSVTDVETGPSVDVSKSRRRLSALVKAADAETFTLRNEEAGEEVRDDNSANGEWNE